MGLQETIQFWFKVVTSPGEDIFIEEKKHDNANLGTALRWIVIAAVIIALFAILGVFINRMFGPPATTLGQYLNLMGVEPDVVDEIVANLERSITVDILSAILQSIILFPILFFITSGIYWLIAKLFGGSGSFGLQSYMMASFFAPLMIFNAILNLFPLIGAFLTFLVALYIVILNYFAIKVAHKMQPGRAVLTVLMPYILVGFFFCCLLVAAGAAVNSFLNA